MSKKPAKPLYQAGRRRITSPTSPSNSQQSSLRGSAEDLKDVSSASRNDVPVSSIDATPPDVSPKDISATAPSETRAVSPTDAPGSSGASRLEGRPGRAKRPEKAIYVPPSLRGKATSSPEEPPNDGYSPPVKDAATTPTQPPHASTIPIQPPPARTTLNQQPLASTTPTQLPPASTTPTQPPPAFTTPTHPLDRLQPFTDKGQAQHALGRLAPSVQTRKDVGRTPRQDSGDYKRPSSNRKPGPNRSSTAASAHDDFHFEDQDLEWDSMGDVLSTAAPPHQSDSTTQRQHPSSRPANPPRNSRGRPNNRHQQGRNSRGGGSSRVPPLNNEHTAPLMAGYTEIESSDTGQLDRQDRQTVNSQTGPVDSQAVDRQIEEPGDRTSVPRTQSDDWESPPSDRTTRAQSDDWESPPKYRPANERNNSSRGRPVNERNNSSRDRPANEWNNSSRGRPYSRPRGRPANEWPSSSRGRASNGRNSPPRRKLSHDSTRDRPFNDRANSSRGRAPSPHTDRPASDHTGKASSPLRTKSSDEWENKPGGASSNDWNTSSRDKPPKEVNNSSRDKPSNEWNSSRGKPSNEWNSSRDKPSNEWNSSRDKPSNEWNNSSRGRAVTDRRNSSPHRRLSSDWDNPPRSNDHANSYRGMPSSPPRGRPASPPRGRPASPPRGRRSNERHSSSRGRPASPPRRRRSNDWVSPPREGSPSDWPSQTAVRSLPDPTSSSSREATDGTRQGAAPTPLVKEGAPVHQEGREPVDLDNRPIRESTVTTDPEPKTWAEMVEEDDSPEKSDDRVDDKVDSRAADRTGAPRDIAWGQGDRRQHHRGGRQLSGRTAERFKKLEEFDRQWDPRAEDWDQQSRRGGIIHLPPPSPPPATPRAPPVVRGQGRANVSGRVLYDPDNSESVEQQQVEGQQAWQDQEQKPLYMPPPPPADEVAAVVLGQVPDPSPLLRQVASIKQLELYLQTMVSTSINGMEQFATIMNARTIFMDTSAQLLVSEPAHFLDHHLERSLWNNAYRHLVDKFRNEINTSQSDTAALTVYKKHMTGIICEGLEYYSKILMRLIDQYKLDLEPVFNDLPVPATLKVSRSSKAAHNLCHFIYLCLGDLARYQEDNKKARSYYLKAQQLAPKNGRTYNQLAILAFASQRKLDAVYYFIRALNATNPFTNSSETLSSIFDTVWKGHKELTARRTARRKAPSRRVHQPRVEVWIRADGSKLQKELRDEEDLDQDLATLPVAELNKQFNLDFLSALGKLIRKIGMESYMEQSSQMLLELQALLEYTPGGPLDNSRLQQLVAVTLYAVDLHAGGVQRGVDQSDPLVRPMQLEHSLQLLLDLAGLITKRINHILQEEQQNKGALQRDLSDSVLQLIPSLVVIADWLIVSSRTWSPPPLSRDPTMGPCINLWHQLALLINLLMEVDETSPVTLCEEPGKDRVEVILPEEKALQGFHPMNEFFNSTLSKYYVSSGTSTMTARDCLRIHKLVYLGEVLPGFDPPVLHYNVLTKKYEATTDERDEEKEERVHPISDVEDENTAPVGDESFSDKEDDSSDIRHLRQQKKALQKKLGEQNLQAQSVRSVLREEVELQRPIQLVITPLVLVPDTNCYIDHLQEIKSILRTEKYTVVVPLVVVTELDGLSRGVKEGSYHTYEHAEHVHNGAIAAVAFLEKEFEDRNRQLKAMTSKGTLMDTILYRSEQIDQIGNNDDTILSCCLYYCEDHAREYMPKSPDEPIRLTRSVVLLTDDRNLRLKAHTRNVPVKEIPSFVLWARIV